MGYSKSKRVIRRVESYLQQMVAATGELSFPAEDASKFAYQLREGIGSSKIFAKLTGGEPIVSYAKLASKYLIRTKGNMVVCEPREVVLSVKQQTLGQVSIPDVSDTMGIIGAAIMHKAPVMIFPDASDETVNEMDQIRIGTWCEKNGYEATFADNHITLTRKTS